MRAISDPANRHIVRAYAGATLHMSSITSATASLLSAKTRPCSTPRTRSHAHSAGSPSAPDAALGTATR
eukprot:6176883-Pleurochrysis_carterae.AAC.3